MFAAATLRGKVAVSQGGRRIRSPARRDAD
jgi:hypothetical protein